jgi:hypothetical protein
VQHLLEGIGRVRVIDDDERLSRRPAHPPGDGGQADKHRRRIFEGHPVGDQAPSTPSAFAMLKRPSWVHPRRGAPPARFDLHLAVADAGRGEVLAALRARPETL